MTMHRDQLAAIRSFPSLVKYLRDEMGWPIGADSFEDLTFDYAPEELGIDPKNAAKIEEIKRLRPLASGQPWGIFFVKFEPKRLPVVALRRILSQVVLKKRATAKAAELAAWAADDLLFISNYGEGDARHISFAHFSLAEGGTDLPTLKVLGWDNLDTPLHLGDVAERLKRNLSWPNDEEDAKAWRQAWRGAFALQHREVITTSQALSVRLAELARAIRDRIGAALAIETENGPLSRLMKAFQGTLVHDLDKPGFADMYAQTIAYGLLSSRIANPKSRTADDFAAHMRTNPLLRELMQTFLQAGGRRGRTGGPEIDFDELGVSEVVGLLDRANMEAVLRDFGDRNPQEDPVIHFYELFLKEYDSKKRMQRGVFYTPRPVVSYIVRSVDELLRTEFGLADGLADTTTWGEMVKRHKDLKIPEGVSPDQDFVQILDPATGTGTFLVEVIELVYRTMVVKWRADGHDDKKIDSLWNAYVPKHLLTRLHGYELLMAPYAIAHLKVGLKLYETGYSFAHDARARIYLTNALEPPLNLKQSHLAGVVPALAHEVAAVNSVKTGCRFTVLVGNPPYSDHSQNLGEQFASLIAPFRIYNGERIRERGAIRFEHAINNDYVKFWGLCLKLLSDVPLGTASLITSNSYLGGRSFRGVRDAMRSAVYSIQITDLHGEGWAGQLTRSGKIDENVFDIQTGVAICRLAKSKAPFRTMVQYGEIVGTYEQKSDSLLQAPASIHYEQVVEDLNSYSPFLPKTGVDRMEYWDYPQLDSIFHLSVDGIKTSRDGLVIANTHQECVSKISSFMNDKETQDDLEQRLKFECGRLNLVSARKHVARTFNTEKVIRIAYRPYDIRFIYYDPKLILSHRNNTMPRILFEGCGAIVCASRLSSKGFSHALATRTLCSNKYASHDINSRMFLVTYGGGLSGGHIESGADRRLLDQIEFPEETDSTERARMFGFYVLAILSAPSFKRRYLDQIQQDFPRIPVTQNYEFFEGVSKLGSLIAEAQYLAMDAPPERFAFRGDFGERCEAPKFVGGTLRISKRSFIEGVPKEVWEFEIAGYQVCSSWFSAGGRSGLARKAGLITENLIAEFRKVLFCVEETIRIQNMVDEFIEAYGGWPDAFAAPDADG